MPDSNFYVTLRTELDRLEVRRQHCERVIRENSEANGSYYFTTAEYRDEAATLNSLQERIGLIERLLAEDDL